MLKKNIIFSGLALVSLILASAFLAVARLSSTDTCASVADINKTDCHPEDGANEQACLARGCCWTPGSSKPVPNVPWCHFPERYAFGYQEAWRIEGNDVMVLNMIRRGPSGLPGDINQVMVQVSAIDEARVRIKIIDPSDSRFEVGLPKLNLDVKRDQRDRLYSAAISADLKLTILRKATGTVLFDTDLTKLIFSNQYLQLTNRVPAKYLYGLGEHRDVFRKEVNWKRYTMLNNDRPPEKSKPGYGTQPFYMMVEDGQANCHGVLFFNNHPQDIMLQPTPAVTYKSIGGIFDFIIYLGPSAKDVVRQHVSLIGKPDLPPYWGLGFQLSKYGYGSLDETKKVMQRNIDAGVPLDVQWNDIDSLDRNNDFTYDHVKFKGLPEFVDDLHRRGMRYVPIVDIAISGAETPGTYAPLDEGLAMDIFIKNSTDQLFIGKVWNLVSSVFPDFTHPNASRWWASQLRQYLAEVPIDGVWIDMNEPANFFDGQYDAVTGQGTGCPSDSLENPPFMPGAPEHIGSKTLCMSAKQFLGRHYDLHNMQAIYEAKATKEALLGITGKRQFIISRATATGQGSFGMHWSGDILSDWDSMGWTIPSILEFSMFGFPLMGADICGFVNPTEYELCARWSSLGAFYPFSRNHNAIDQLDQDPAAMGGDVLSAAKYALNIRYTILPYLYTLFYQASSFGDTVARPLFFEFPEDPQSYLIETQFMLGPAVMVVPVLEKGSTQVNAYFPSGVWYHDEGSQIQSNGTWSLLDIPLDRIYIGRRGGQVIANLPAKPTTTAQRSEPFEFSVYLDNDGQAQGQLYWDDGESPSSLLTMSYCLYKLEASHGSFTTVPVVNNYSSNMTASAVHVYGVSSQPGPVIVNDVEISTISWNPSLARLDITNLTLSLAVENTVSWSADIGNDVL
ncbi:Lysosomal alpha-glucosidase [Halotydeus destructor]|nr:Lysosomal alpha-glucosidase [Halotydeus destructor]